MSTALILGGITVLLAAAAAALHLGGLRVQIQANKDHLEKLDNRLERVDCRINDVCRRLAGLEGTIK